MAKKQFKAESKRLLDLMINSIYTHQEIFLREIISNASDAIDKLAYLALTDENVGLSRSDFAIQLKPDETARTLTVSDNGIGMDKDEMENNLGTICRSGSLQFKQTLDKDKAADTDIIGQFGVGFYSAFMVADKVTVISKKYGSDEAWKWESEGADGYTMTPCERANAGTDVIMQLKADTDDEKYSRFLKTWELQQLVRKYSDYIRYPIRMEVEKSRMKEGTEKDEKPEYETYTEVETLNSMVPIWNKNKKDVTDEEYNNFYKEKFFDFEDPLAVIHANVEGAVTYKALLYIPAKAPYDFYTKDFKKGLQLYSSGVMIMENCADLLPDCFRFVRGVVDSQDLSLNISREMLQHDRQLKFIAGNLEKRSRLSCRSCWTTTARNMRSSSPPSARRSNTACWPTTARKKRRCRICCSTGRARKASSSPSRNTPPPCRRIRSISTMPTARAASASASCRRWKSCSRRATTCCS